MWMKFTRHDLTQLRYPQHSIDTISLNYLKLYECYVSPCIAFLFLNFVPYYGRTSTARTQTTWIPRKLGLNFLFFHQNSTEIYPDNLNWPPTRTVFGFPLEFELPPSLVNCLDWQVGLLKLLSHQPKKINFWHKLWYEWEQACFSSTQMSLIIYKLRK